MKENTIEGLYCECHNEADRNCDRCQAYLCDNCDKGTHTDQCSLCSSCKNEQIEFYAAENVRYWEGVNDDLLLIKNNYQYHPDNMIIKKFAALAELVNWNVGNVCADNTKDPMTNERYRYIKRQLIEGLEIGHLQRIITSD